MEPPFLPEPVAGPGEVKIRVEFAGICGTDVHVVRDEYPNEPPVVLGHEFCGTIAAIGEGVEGFRAGDRVTASVRALPVLHVGPIQPVSASPGAGLQ